MAKFMDCIRESVIDETAWENIEPKYIDAIYGKMEREAIVEAVQQAKGEWMAVKVERDLTYNKGTGEHRFTVTVKCRGVVHD